MTGIARKPRQGTAGWAEDNGQNNAHSRLILGMRTDTLNCLDASERIIGWASARESRYVCVANVHMAMESHDSADYREIVNTADLVTPDGMPLVWALRLLGVSNATRVTGYALTLTTLNLAAAAGIPVGFYGSTPSTLQAIVREAIRRFPSLQITYAYAPPFRPLSVDERGVIVSAITSSNARILFVGLGCPKQERWMADHREMTTVTIGVGAVFDFLAGTKPIAPSWMQRTGTEWLFRLSCEPRRLWFRYAYHNPRFAALVGLQYIRTLIT